MNATLIATFAGLITAFCWGTSDWLAARSTKKLSALQVNFAVQSISLAVAGVLLVVSGLELHTAEQLIRIGASSTLITLAFMIFLKALSFGTVGIVVPLGNIYPLFTIALSVIFLDAYFSSVQLIAMVGIVLGVALLAYEKNVQKIPLTKLHRQTLLAFIAALVWGFAFFVLDPIVDQVPWQTISIVGELCSFVFAFIVTLAVTGRQFGQQTAAALNTGIIYIVGVLGMAGMIAYYVGVTRAGSVAIPTVLAGAGPLIASVWAAMLDHERLGALKRIGALITVAGIIVLNLF